MDTQNVSAQLYFKQLPIDQTANETQSDAEIETAFQKQLDLSEFYKSSNVFDAVKRDFMDKTVEGQESPPEITPVAPPLPPSIPVNKTVGPTDFLYTYIKEGFGSNFNLFLIFLIAAIIIIAYLT
jgi:hypothetical protein